MASSQSGSGAAQPGRGAAQPGNGAALLGLAAEQRACEFLVTRGLDILLRNYRCRLGELDIVARDRDTLVVAEVRLRADSSYGGAAASITFAKRQRICRATRHLIACRPALRRLPVRFDVLLLCADETPVEWLRGAFDAC